MMATNVMRITVFLFFGTTTHSYGGDGDAMLDIFMATIAQAQTYRCTTTVDYSTTSNKNRSKSVRYETSVLADNLTNRIRLKFRKPNGKWYTVIQNAEDNILHAGGSAQVTISAGNRSFDDATVRPMDCFAAPLLGPGGMRLGVTLKQLVDGFRQCDSKIVSKNGDLVAVEYRSPASDGVFSRIVFDKARGMVPVEYLAAFEQGEHIPLNHTTAEWILIGQAYLPSVVECRSTANGRERVAIVSVDWTDVNEPIDPGEFTISALGLPVGTHVVNTKLGIPVVEEILGKDIPRAIIEANDKSRVVRKAPFRRRVIVVVSLCVCCAVLCLLGLRRYRKMKTL